MGDISIAHQSLSDGQRSRSDAQRDVYLNSAGSETGVRPEDADEVFDEFWSLPPEQVGTQLKTLEEAERSRRGSRASSFRYDSDQEAPGKRGRGLVRLASDVVKKLEEEVKQEAERDAIQTEVSEVAERAAESGEPPEEIVREMETRWGGELTEEERKALERLTQYQDWPGGINWGVPGGRVNQVGESHNPGGQNPGHGNPGGQETETKVVAVPPGEVEEADSKEPVEAQPSPTSPLGFDFDAAASEAGESSAGTPRDMWSPTTEADSAMSAVSGGDQGTLRRVDSWYEKSFTGRAKDVMESIVKGWWMEFPEWPGVAS